MCHCGEVVKELLTRAEKSGPTPGDVVFHFFVLFLFIFFCLVFVFPFGLFSFILTDDHADHALESGVLFWKKDFKSS